MYPTKSHSIERADRSVPYITGWWRAVHPRVAGACLPCKAVKPTYRLALLTALAFCWLRRCAGLHLDIRSARRRCTSLRTTRRPCMFGYVYMWYLMLCWSFEIWLDYRREIVSCRSRAKPAAPCLQGNDARLHNISERSLAIETWGWIVSWSAFLRLSAAWIRRVHLRLAQGQSWWSCR